MAQILEQLRKEDSLDGVGYSEDDIDALVQKLRDEEHADRELTDDGPDDPPAVAIAKTGDLWCLGEHRLLCGDSTSLKDVHRVMGNDKAALVATDPPYLVDYTGERGSGEPQWPPGSREAARTSCEAKTHESEFTAARDCRGSQRAGVSFRRSGGNQDGVVARCLCSTLVTLMWRVATVTCRLTQWRVNTMRSEHELKFDRPIRSTAVLAVMLGLTSLALLSCAVTPPNPVAPPSSPQPRTDDFALLPRFLSGVWRVTYRNGAIRTYVFQPGGKVQFVEVNLHCTLCTRPEVLLSFDDGKIERLWISGDEFRVEHWDPATDYPGGEPLTGIGRRLDH